MNIRRGNCDRTSCHDARASDRRSRSIPRSVCATSGSFTRLWVTSLATLQPPSVGATQPASATFFQPMTTPDDDTAPDDARVVNP